MVSSTVSSNFAEAISLSFLTASLRLYLRAGSIFSNAARYFFPCFFILELRGSARPDFEVRIANCQFATRSAMLCSRWPLPLLSTGTPGAEQFRNPKLFDRQAHLSGSALDRANSALQIRSVQVRHLGFGDLFQFGARNLADLFFLGIARTFLDPGGLLQ